METPWFAFISNGVQPAINAVQSKSIQAINGSERYSKYPAEYSLAQTVERGATVGSNNTDNMLQISSAI